jgi:hypothetical protein
MGDLRRRNKANKRPAWLGWAGDLLIPSILFLVFFAIPISAAYDITDNRYPQETAFANGAVALANQISFHTVLKGNRSGVRESVQTVARNQAEWSALWKRHASIEPNPPPLPAMDFSKEIVAAVFLGEKPTGGHDIEITSVEQRDGSLLVSFVERSPQPGGVVTQAFTQPFHIVKVAAQSTARVNFRRLP